MDGAQQPALGDEPKPPLVTRLVAFLIGPKARPRNLDPKMLAVDRTRLANERTMMAWIRTGLSLITFGFSIYKFFQIQEASAAVREGLIGPRTFGFMMILIGVLSILLAALQRHREIQSLRAAGAYIPPSLANIIAALVSLLGILGLLAVAFRQ